MSVCVAWHTTGFTTVDDLLHRELSIGGTGPGDDTIQFPLSAIVLMMGMIVTFVWSARPAHK